MNWETLVGDNIREARRSKGMTQEHLAEVAGLDLRYLGSIERGKGNPSVKILGQIADALKIKPSTLLEVRQPSGPSWD